MLLHTFRYDILNENWKVAYFTIYLQISENYDKEN